MQCQVVFTHDDNAKKWECRVHGVKDAKEARQAFAAVVLTCEMIDGGLQIEAAIAKPVEGITNAFDIKPAV